LEREREGGREKEKGNRRREGDDEKDRRRRQRGKKSIFGFHSSSTLHIPSIIPSVLCEQINQ
jgi:hypothetical protein